MRKRCYCVKQKTRFFVEYQYLYHNCRQLYSVKVNISVAVTIIIVVFLYTILLFIGYFHSHFFTTSKGHPLDGDPILIAIPTTSPVVVADMTDEQKDYDILWEQNRLVNSRLHVVRKISTIVNVHSQRAVTFRALVHYQRWLKATSAGKPTPTKQVKVKPPKALSQRPPTILTEEEKKSLPAVPKRQSLLVKKNKSEGGSKTGNTTDTPRGMPSAAIDEGDEEDDPYLQPRDEAGFNEDDDYEHVVDEEADYSYLAAELEDGEEDYMSQAAILAQLQELQAKEKAEKTKLEKQENDVENSSSDDE
eukprot:m.27778 g.27778  ORF g.27778 m.27778 type:complete len:305 (-) comp9399_c0_seq1:122-1036(-)